MRTNRLVKIILGTIASIAILILLFILVIEFGFKRTCPPPEKPEGIPTVAIWNGGCDGGYWVELVEIKESKYRFRIYLDYKAEVLMDADFILKEACGINFPKDITILKMITIVQVDKILLNYQNQDCILQPVYPAYGGSSWEIIKEKGEYLIEKPS